MSTSPPAAAAAAVPMGARARGAVLILCGAIFLEGIDVAMLNVALPAIRAELGLSTTTLSAVVSAYVLGYAGFTLGLVAGGFLLVISWRWVFFAPVILSALILALAPRLIADDGQRSAGGRFDMPGAVTLTGAMLAAAYAVTRLENPGEGLHW